MTWVSGVQWGRRVGRHLGGQQNQERAPASLYLITIQIYNIYFKGGESAEIACRLVIPASPPLHSKQRALVNMPHPVLGISTSPSHLSPPTPTAPWHLSLHICFLWARNYVWFISASSAPYAGPATVWMLINLAHDGQQKPAPPRSLPRGCP